MNKVSIIVPVWNAYKFVSICLDSLIGQTYKDIEIIAVDDGSDDQSVELLKKYKDKYPFFKYVSYQPNQGVSHARNVGMKRAKGEYIFFIDSDDFIDNNTIEILVKKAEEYKADVVETEKVYWYKKGSKLLTFTERKKLKNDLVLNSIHEDNRSIILPRYVTGKLYKRRVVENIEFDEKAKCYEDALFNHQIKNNFNRYVYAKDAYYHYFQRPSSLINTFGSNHLDYAYVGKKIKKLYEKNNYYNLPIKSIVDKLILSDILVILAVKIPLMKISMKEKKKYAYVFFNMIDELSLKGLRGLVFLFKSNIFRTIYYALVSHLNLIGISFSVLNLFNHCKVNDIKTKNKVLELYKIMY